MKALAVISVGPRTSQAHLPTGYPPPGRGSVSDTGELSWGATVNIETCEVKSGAEGKVLASGKVCV